MRKRYSYGLLLLTLLVPLLVVIVYIANKNDKQSDKTQAQTTQLQTPTATVIAKNLEIPWSLTFLPDNQILFTERPGRVKLLALNTGQVTQIALINEVKPVGEGGLLGVAAHPQFAANKFIYVYYTYSSDGTNMMNRVVRYTFTNNQLTAPTTIVDAIPGATNHNGGRIRFGPDGFLYITTGDAQVPSLAQDPNSLAGKILRVTDTGAAAPGNPFNNRTYSYGHRNSQGIAWDRTILYETEHGNSSPSRYDEVNQIEPGNNYGWPTIEGDAGSGTMVKPLLHSGPDGTTTWAPGGTAFYNGSIFFSGLKGQALYESVLQGTQVTLKATYFKSELGRIREVIVGPDGFLYITTSNRDGRGTPKAEDDKILRVSFSISGTQPTTQPVTPTYGVIAPCPSCITTPTVFQPSISAAPLPSNIIATPITSIAPCDAENASIAHSKHKSKHKQHGGDVSGIMEALLRFLIELLNLLLRLIGGGTPIPTPTPDPGTSPTASPNPCAPTIAPTNVLPSTIPTTSPTTVITTPTVTQSVSVAPTTAPTQVLACIPSGQKCDATGTRKCCTNACVQNINPNFPDDPGTCD